MLVDLYQTNSASLLNVQQQDFDAGQWEALAQHLDNEASHSYQMEYDAQVVRRILSVIGTTKTWFETTLAQRFLYVAIAQEDCDTIEFILSTFEHVRAKNWGVEDHETYLESAVDNINAGKDPNGRVLNTVLQYFRDNGSALMAAVRWGNLDVVATLLPHSDPSYHFFLPYRWAQVYNFHDIENLLEPVSSKTHALFGYSVGRWPEPEDQVVARKREASLREAIECNAFDEPLAHLYTQGLTHPVCFKGTLLHSEDAYVLAMLWKDKNIANAHAALEYVDVIEDAHASDLIKNIPTAFEIIVPRLSAKAQQKILVASAFNNDRVLADCLFAHGVDVDQARERLGNVSNLMKMSSVPALSRNLEKRAAACTVLDQWISEWQAQTIRCAIGDLGRNTAPSKL